MKLFVITQAVDSTHPALGFFVEWIRSFRKHPSVSRVTVASFDRLSEGIDDVVIHRISKQGRWGLMKTMWALLRSSEWDVLFVHMTPVWCIACWPIVLLKGKKMVLWYTHGTASMSLRLACLLSNEIYTATANAFPLRSSKCFAVGHGVPEQFGSVERGNISGHRYLSIGRLSRRKRVVETLEFFARIVAMDPQATLTWAGSGTGDVQYEIDIEQTIHQLKLESCVQMIGPIVPEQTLSVYASHDLLLHLSATGSLDKVVIESLMAGCAVMSTNQATAEGLGAEWLWNDSLDDTAAAEALKRAREGVSSETRQKISRQYGLTSFIDRLCKMMFNLIARA